jgi:hypothetical protein
MLTKEVCGTLGRNEPRVELHKASDLGRSRFRTSIVYREIWHQVIMHNASLL